MSLEVVLWVLAAVLSGQVVGVADGDTLRVQVGAKVEKVRLVGIDCPEVAHGPRDPGQEPWGTLAAQFTKERVLGKQVRLETDVQRRDRYGRLLAYVFQEKLFLNLELLRQGHAMLLTYPPNVKYVDRFTQAQKEARTAGRGIWNADALLPQTPYEYRHRNNSPSPRPTGR